MGIREPSVARDAKRQTAASTPGRFGRALLQHSTKTTFRRCAGIGRRSPSSPLW